MIQSGGFITGMTGIFDFPTLSKTLYKLLINSYIKELINTDFEIDDAFVDLFKNFKIFSPSKDSKITLTNDEIKYIIKVIKSLENRNFIKKRLLEKLLVKKEDFSIFADH